LHEAGIGNTEPFGIGRFLYPSTACPVSNHRFGWNSGREDSSWHSLSDDWENTAPPGTLTLGTSKLVRQDMEQVKKEVWPMQDGNSKKGSFAVLWDGKASGGIADVIVRGMKSADRRR